MFIPISLNIQDLIIKSIDELNNLFHLKELNQRLSTKYSNYNFKPAKKTGKAKIDLPIIEKDIKVFDTGIEHFALLYIKSDLINVNKTFRCFNCPIL